MNRLSKETSPYLLQHQNNPVHWYAWGDLPFEVASAQNKPVLLSSGYAACHWCHVMAHECFENQDIAAFMNEHFINIKLDREERPDVDQLYMTSLHAMGEQGGWPLNVFLTPDRHPFWGGTYFPPQPAHGRPSFMQVLQAIERLWTVDRDRARSAGQTLIEHLKTRNTKSPPEGQVPNKELLEQAAATIAAACDPRYGGIKGAPKFPQAPIFLFLENQRRNANEPIVDNAVTATLTNIANGGIYDHLGGGIARYSTDHHWLVPHFEKMLYDNAQFVSLASRYCATTPHPLLSSRVEQTITFMLRDMTSTEGLFTSSYDADSEGEEGRYYVWTYDELLTHLPSSTATDFIATYGATPQGNFEGRNILNRLGANEGADEDEAKLAYARALLKSIRDQRQPPLHDDKVLLDWNALAITALIEAAVAFRRDDWLDIAHARYDLLLKTFWNGTKLWHSTRQSILKHHATAHDFAALIETSLTVSSTRRTGNSLDIARQITTRFETEFWDEEQKGFLLTSRSTNDLPTNTLPITDDVTPSPNAVMVKNYIKLAHLTDDNTYLDKATSIRTHHAATALANPFAAPALLHAAALFNNTVQLTCCGSGPVVSELLGEVISQLGLDVVIIPKHGAEEQLTICRGTTCSLPITNKKGVKDALRFVGL